MQIIILGMHRSGTSAVTRLINMMDAYLCPENLLMPAHAANPKGYWERLDVVTLNDRILAAANAAWDRPTHFAIEHIDTATRAELDKEAQHILHTMDTHRPWVLKDPRMCLTFPLWRPLLELPLCIHVVRDPIQVARSLAVRDQFSLSFGVDLWEKYHISALRAAQGLPQLCIAHDDLLRDPIGSTEQLHAALSAHGVAGLRLPQAQEITAFIDPTLYRQRSDDTLTRTILSQTQTELLAALSNGQLETLALDDWPLAATEARLHDYEELLAYRQLIPSLQQELTQAQTQQAHMNTQLQAQDEQIPELQAQLTDSQQKNTFLQQALTSRNQQQQLHNNEIARLQQAATEHTVQYSRLTQQLVTLKTQHENKLREFAAREQSITTELAASQQHLTQQQQLLHEREQTLATELAASNQQQQALHEQVQALTTELAAQQQAMQTLHTLLAQAQQPATPDPAILLHHLDQLDHALNSLLHSFTWKTGLAIAEIYRKITFARRQPLAHDRIQTLLHEVHLWKQAHQALADTETPTTAGHNTSP